MKRNMHLMLLSTLCLLALPLTACSGQERLYTIGALQMIPHPTIDAVKAGFVQALADAGYKDGENVRLDFQNAQGEMSNAPLIARKFVSDKVDMMFAIGTPPLQATVQAAPETMPVVFALVSNPWGAGAGTSMTEHLPHVTGASASSPVAEQLDLVREVLPQADKVGWIWCTAQVSSEFYVGLARKRAAELGIELLEANVNTSADVKQAAQSVVARGADVIVDGADNITSSAIDAVIGVAESSGLPFITVYPNLADRGAVIAQGWNYVENGRKTAELAARVLEGEDPAAIPFQTLDVKKLIVNEASAQRLGLTIPPELLSRAEDVIR